MIDTENTVELKASELEVGDAIDLESDPELSKVLIAEFELVEVVGIETHGEKLVVSYNGVGPVGVYSPDDVLRGRKRED